MAERIFYVSPGTDLGGGEISLLTLIANLDRNRFEPIVCAYGPGRFAERLEALDCEYHIHKYANLLNQARFVIALACLIHRSRASIVHVNTLDIRAGVAARLSGRKLIGHLRVIFPTTWVDRAFVNLATTTISVSNAARDHICQAQGLSHEKFTTIYNAIAIPEDASPSENLRQNLKLSSDAPLFGVIGRIDPWKGIETFVEAAGILRAEFPGAHYVVAGAPGPSQEEKAYEQLLRTRVKTLGLNSAFHFLGFRTDALALIQQFNALVVPSRILQTPTGIKTEGFGRAAAEGLAMRTPVIASRVGGLPEIIDAPRTGLLFEPEHAPSLASAMRFVLNNPEEIASMTQAGYARFQDHFSVSCHLREVQTLYDRILNYQKK